MIDLRVAGRYAKALYQAALKQNALDAVRDDLNGLADAMVQSERLRKFLVSPDHSRDSKLGLLDSAFGTQISPLSKGVIRLMFQKGREDLIVPVRDEFMRLYREHENVLRVRITSALPLEDQHLGAIVRKIETATVKRVEAEVAVDPSLMGGVKVEVGGYVMDGTVSGSLARMKEKLVYDLLKQA